MSRLRAYLVAIAIAVASTPVGAETAPPKFSGFASVADEIAVGRAERPAILTQFGGEGGTPAFRRYVMTMGESLARGIATKDMPFVFTVLDSPVVNAFSTPGGFIYLTRGLTALADSESEIAAVLAHEIAHHAAQQYPRRDRKTLLGNLRLAGLGDDDDGALGEVLAVGALPSFTRDEELDADTLALRILARGGYDTGALARMLRKLHAEARLAAQLRGEDSDGTDPFGWPAGHPIWDGRIARAAETAERDGVGGRESSRDAYLDAIDGLPYGGDPRHGVVMGRAFVDAKRRFRFEAPPEFHLFALPNGAVAFGPRGARLVFDVAQDSPNATAERHLAKTWTDGDAISRIETIEIGGLEAATAVSRGRSDAGEADVRLVAIRGGGGTFYRFAFATPPEHTAELSSALRRAAYSFRRLDEGDAGTVAPMALRVVTVGPGDTVQSLSERMPFARNRRERFEVLNGLVPGAQVAPGLRVKLVTGVRAADP